MKELILNTKDQGIWFTSDSHYSHARIIEFCSRPFESVEEMDEELISRWNSRIKPGDIIFHLGDFAFCGPEKFKEILGRLNGRKYLVLGNHDWNHFGKEEMLGFEGIYQQLRLTIDGQRIYLNHFPYLCFEGAVRGKTWQLFGHVHSREGIESDYPDHQRMKYLFPTQMDVGVDGHNYYPWSFGELRKEINKRKKEEGH